MNLEQIHNYHNFTLQQILQQQLSNPRPNQDVIVYMIAKKQSPTPIAISMVLNLLERRDGKKWLKVIQKFAQIDFKLTFAICIKNIHTYPAIMKQVAIQGQLQHIKIFQNNMNNRLRVLKNDSLQLSIFFPFYLDYLKQWISLKPSSSLNLLQQIQINISQNYYIQMQKFQRIRFITYICSIVHVQQKIYLHKLQLRNLWSSLINTIEYLKFWLKNNKIILSIANSLEGVYQPDSQQTQQILLLFLSSSKLKIIQQIFIQYMQRISMQLLKMPLIISRYKNNRMKSIQQFEEIINLQNSLIYHIISDDNSSLIQQVLTQLSISIPNFIPQFLQNCFILLKNFPSNETLISDIILKLSILSKQIIIASRQNNEFIVQIKRFIDNFVYQTNVSSQFIQIKIVKLMYYFRQILPQSYFQKYHDAVFRIIKDYINNCLSYNHQINQKQNNTIKNNQNYLFQNFNRNNKTNQLEYKYLFFLECIQILQDQFQIQQQQHLQTKIKNKKINNKTIIYDLIHKNILWLSDKIIDLIISFSQFNKKLFQNMNKISNNQLQLQYHNQFQQYEKNKYQQYPQQIFNGRKKIYQIYCNLITKYQSLKDRNHVYLLKILTSEFLLQFDRLRKLQLKKRNYSILNLIIQCIKITVQGITQDTYIESQQYLTPVIQLINQPYTFEFQQEILSLISILLKKANIITPELNNFIIYTKNYIIKNNSNILILQEILRQTCNSLQIIRSIEGQWFGLITFYLSIFLNYIKKVKDEQSIHCYYNQWKKSAFLIQLFIQTFQQSIRMNQMQPQYQLQQKNQSQDFFNSNNNNKFNNNNNNNNNDNYCIKLLYEINKILQTFQQTEQVYLIMMSINHIAPNKLININPYNLISFMTQKAKYKYSVDLSRITLLDMLSYGLKHKIFDLQLNNNQIHTFFQRFYHYTSYLSELQQNKLNYPYQLEYYRYEKSDYDMLPFNKIKLNIYTEETISQLYKNKIIDIQEYTEFKNKLIDQRYLIKKDLFQ